MMYCHGVTTISGDVYQEQHVEGTACTYMLVSSQRQAVVNAFRT